MRNGYFGIWLTLAIALGVMVMFQLLGSIGVIAFYGIEQEAWNSQGVLLINSFAQIVTMGGAAWLVTRAAHQDTTVVLRLDPRRSRASVPIYLLIVPLTVAAQVLGGALVSLWMHVLSLAPSLFEALKNVQDMLDISMKKLVIADTPEHLVIALIAIAVVPALCEELFFRGFVFANIERSAQAGRRIRTAIVVSAIAFGLSHLSPLNLPAIVILGLIFGWLISVTDDIRVTMTAHFINNGIIVVGLFFLGHDPDIADALLSSEILPVPDSLIAAAISGVILMAILSYIRKLADKLSPNMQDEHSA